MTEDDIMQAAREAGPLTKGPFDAWCKRFAALVAAHKAEVITAEAYRCGHEAGANANLFAKTQLPISDPERKRNLIRAFDRVKKSRETYHV